MTGLAKFFLVGGPLLLVLMTALAGYSYSKIRALSLPIPQALALFTVVLPLITGISLQGTYGLILRQPKHGQYQLTIPLITVIGFQLVYETVVATLALTYILPPSSLGCGLNNKWTNLFRQKNGEAIRAIQDAFDCCGLHGVKDMAYPFGEPSPCAGDFGRDKACFGPWKKSEQINAGLLVLVAVLVFAVKAMSIIALLTSASWTHSWTRPFKRLTHRRSGGEPEDNRATMRRLIEEGDEAESEPYRDNPDAEAAVPTPVATNGQGLRVEPSPLADSHNQWRDEEH